MMNKQQPVICTFVLLFLSGCISDQAPASVLGAGSPCADLHDSQTARANVASHHVEAPVLGTTAGYRYIELDRALDSGSATLRVEWNASVPMNQQLAVSVESVQRERVVANKVGPAPMDFEISASEIAGLGRIWIVFEPARLASTGIGAVVPSIDVGVIWVDYLMCPDLS